MKRQPDSHSSIDGFVPRRNRGIDQSTQLGSTSGRPVIGRPSSVQLGSVPQTLPRPRSRDISESLANIDDYPEAPSLKRRRKLIGKKSSKSWTKRILKLLVALVILGAIIYGAFLMIAASKILHGNLLSLIEPGLPLKTDSEGRTNILILGTSQDDAAHQQAQGGGGLWLTDSIMLVSLNQKTHTVKMVSIPRDLWVNMPSGCMVGYQAKINAVYECGAGLAESDSSAAKKPGYAAEDKQGAQALESTVTDVTGITPQYYIHVNYTVLEKAVDAVGGIQVNIVGDGADGIYDTNFDWDCPNGPFTCKNVYYPHNGWYTLNGKQALFLSRARADGGTYSYKDFGLAQGDFDRQANQQKVLTALKTKAMSSGTLLNPIAVTNLLNALGDNITTDIQAGNYKTLIDFGKKMPSKNGMQSVSLVQAGESVVATQEVDGQSAVVATSGLLDYSSIKAYLARQLSTNPAIAENASVAVYNASGTGGAAGSLASTLEADGLNVTDTGNADAKDSSATYTIYDTTSGKKPGTVQYLLSKLSGSTTTTAPVPSDISTTADIVIVIGSTSGQ